MNEESASSDVRLPVSQTDDDATKAGITSPIGRPGQSNINPVPPRIAGYQMLDLLGSGGMGTVWRARQNGTRRDVALKLLTNRPSEPKARARFLREVELAGSLEHPNVARVYDSGIDKEQYYYAMELVSGVPLDTYVRDRKPRVIALLRLMRTICNAVQQAHFKGIIHRDLKPSNIMVTAAGEPRVLDFGLARPVTPVQGALVTEDGCGRAGTPAYMSPEQAAGRADQIDTRSDVYSLGKILYLLLVGHPAHDLSGAEFDLYRRIVEEDVRRPRLLMPGLHADLEAVLLKALDRNPRNRYGTAGELAKDIDNVLNGDPVSARPATLSYFVGKKLARHRAAAVVLSTFILTLAVLIVFSYVRIRHERNIALAQTLRADAARAQADEERVKAEHEAANAQAINRFFEHLLNALDPKNARGLSNVAREMMDRANRTLSEKFAGDPTTEASIRVTVGRNMLALGQFSTAEAQLSRAVNLMTTAAPASGETGPGPQALAAMDLLAQAHRELGNAAPAAQLSERVYERYKVFFGSQDSRTLSAMNTLAYVLNDLGRRDQAEDRCREALRLAGQIRTAADVSIGNPEPLTLTLISTLTRLLRDSRDPVKIAEAEDWARTVYSARVGLARRAKPPESAMPPVGDPSPPEASDPEVLEAMHDLASVLTVRSAIDPAHAKWDEALKSHRYVVERGAEVLGADHPDLIIWRNDLAAALMEPGPRQDLSEAETIYRAILPAATEIRGSEHLYTVIILNMLAEVNREQGKLADASVYYRSVETYAGRASERLLREFGPDNTQALPFLDAMAGALSYQQRYAESEEAYLKAIKTRERVFGPNNRETLVNAVNLARLYQMSRQHNKARELLTETVTRCKRFLPANDPVTSTAVADLSKL